MSCAKFPPNRTMCSRDAIRPQPFCFAWHWMVKFCVFVTSQFHLQSEFCWTASCWLLQEDNHKGAALNIKKISKFWDVHIVNHSHYSEDIVRSVSIRSDNIYGRYEMQSRTNVHFLVFHLTLADAIVCFITMPMETIWRIVIEVFALQSQRKQNEEKHPSKTSSLSCIEVEEVEF